METLTLKSLLEEKERKIQMQDALLSQIEHIFNDDVLRTTCEDLGKQFDVKHENGEQKGIIWVLWENCSVSSCFNVDDGLVGFIYSHVDVVFNMFRNMDIFCLDLLRKILCISKESFLLVLHIEFIWAIKNVAFSSSCVRTTECVVGSNDNTFTIQTKNGGIKSRYFAESENQTLHPASLSLGVVARDNHQQPKGSCAGGRMSWSSPSSWGLFHNVSGLHANVLQALLRKGIFRVEFRIRKWGRLAEFCFGCVAPALSPWPGPSEGEFPRFGLLDGSASLMIKYREEYNRYHYHDWRNPQSDTQAEPRHELTMQVRAGKYMSDMCDSVFTDDPTPISPPLSPPPASFPEFPLSSSSLHPSPKLAETDKEKAQTSTRRDPYISSCIFAAEVDVRPHEHCQWYERRWAETEDDRGGVEMCGSLDELQESEKDVFSAHHAKIGMSTLTFSMNHVPLEKCVVGLGEEQFFALELCNTVSVELLSLTRVPSSSTPALPPHAPSAIQRARAMTGSLEHMISGGQLVPRIWHPGINRSTTLLKMF